MTVIANRTGPDQIAPQEQSDLGLYCLLRHFLFQSLGLLHHLSFDVKIN